MIAKAMSGENRTASIEQAQLEIPSFAGKYEDWTSYWEIFTSLVDKNPAIDTIMKLKILGSSLYGEARDISLNFKFEEASYEKVKTALKERYGNPLTVLMSALIKVTDYPPIAEMDLLSISKYINLVTQLMIQMNKLDPAHTNIPWLPLCLSKRKLPQSLLIKWEEYCINQIVPPKNMLRMFVKFINSYVERNRSTSLAKASARQLAATADDSELYRNPHRAVQKKKPRQPYESKTSVANFATIAEVADQTAARRALSKKDNVCVFCRGRHATNTCKNRPAPDDCYKIAMKNRLCYKCLDGGHFGKTCKAVCSIAGCSKGHHRFLHRDGSRGAR